MSNKFPELPPGIEAAVKSFAKVSESLGLQHLRSQIVMSDSMSLLAQRLAEINQPFLDLQLKYPETFMSMKQLSQSIDLLLSRANDIGSQMDEDIADLDVYVDDDTSQTANDLVSDLESISKHFDSDSIEIPVKKDKWTRADVFSFISIIIAIVFGLINTGLQIESINQNEQQYQENMELQRQNIEKPVEFPQKFIDVLKDISIGVNKLADSVTMSSDDVPDLVVTDQINDTDKNESK